MDQKDQSNLSRQRKVFIHGYEKLTDSLQKYFKLITVVPYKNVLIDDLHFTANIRRCLKSAGYKTLDEILTLSPQDLLQINYFGRTSFYNLFATLEEFFASDSEIFPAKSVQRATEELDGFLLDAALRHDPQIKLIVAEFENFYASVKRQTFLREVFAPKIKSLPAELLNKKARPFLCFGGLDNAKFFDAIPEDLTLAELPEYFSEKSLVFKISALENFIADFDFDPKIFAKKIAAEVCTTDRERNVMRRRLNDETLKEIGISFGLTRERVRQIEKVIVERLTIRCFKYLKKILYFLQAITGKSVFMIDDAKKFLDDEDAELIWFLAEKCDWSDKPFYFYGKIKSFVFRSVSNFDETGLLRRLPIAMEERSFDTLIENLAREKNYSAELLKAKLLKLYKRSGKFYSCEKLNLIFKCDYILKECFPDGYKIADEKSYLRFMKHLQEIFGKDEMSTQRNVDTRISEVGVLCDRGKYTHPDFVHVSQELIDRVKNYIDTSTHTAIFYKEIFETLKDFLVPESITNRFLLQGVIKQLNFPYILRKDYLTKEFGMDMAKEFDKFIRERGEVSLKDLSEHFVSFRNANTTFLLMRYPQILRIGGGRFLHASQLNLLPTDFEAIKTFLQQNCTKPVSTRILFNLFWKHFADFMMRNKINSYGKLFAILRYIFCNEFNFSRPYISTTDIKDITNKKFLLQVLADDEKIDFEDLIDICGKNGVRYISRSYLNEYLHPEFIRVDEYTLWRPELIGVTDEIVSIVVETVREALERNGGWVTVTAFPDYERLPQLEKPWNSFLLESVATLAEDTFYKLKNPIISVKFSTAIFVSEDFAEDDFKTFLIKVLTAAHEKKPFASEKEILSWLQVNGLCHKKLPKLLEDGKAFQLLNER